MSLLDGPQPQPLLKNIRSILRRPFDHQPSDSHKTDQLMALAQRFLESDAASFAADQLSILAAELQAQIDDLRPELAAATAAAEKAKQEVEQAELSFIRMGEMAGGLPGLGVFEGRQLVQQRGATIDGRRKALADQLAKIQRRQGVLYQMVAELRAIEKPTPEQFKEIFTTSRFWKG